MFKLNSYFRESKLYVALLFIVSLQTNLTYSRSWNEVHPESSKPNFNLDALSARPLAENQRKMGLRRPLNTFASFAQGSHITLRSKSIERRHFLAGLITSAALILDACHVENKEKLAPPKQLSEQEKNLWDWSEYAVALKKAEESHDDSVQKALEKARASAEELTAAGDPEWAKQIESIITTLRKADANQSSDADKPFPYELYDTVQHLNRNFFLARGILIFPTDTDAFFGAIRIRLQTSVTATLSDGALRKIPIYQGDLITFDGTGLFDAAFTFGSAADPAIVAIDEKFFHDVQDSKIESLKPYSATAGDTANPLVQLEKQIWTIMHRGLIKDKGAIDQSTIDPIFLYKWRELLLHHEVIHALTFGTRSEPMLNKFTSRWEALGRIFEFAGAEGVSRVLEISASGLMTAFTVEQWEHIHKKHLPNRNEQFERNPNIIAVTALARHLAPMYPKQKETILRMEASMRNLQVPGFLAFMNFMLSVEDYNIRIAAEESKPELKKGIPGPEGEIKFDIPEEVLTPPARIAEQATSKGPPELSHELYSAG